MSTVSVIIPTYNRARFVLEAVESVLRQTYKDYEIIVVDDGSTDQTRETLEPLIAEEHIRYLPIPHSGVSAARNCGIQLATGKYLSFLDSDDLFAPTKLEKQVSFLDNNPDCSIIHSDYSKLGVDGEDLGYRDTSFYSGWVYPRLLLNWDSPVPLSTLVVRSEVLERVGPFDEGLKRSEDLEWLAGVAQSYSFHRVPESLVSKRVHEANLSGDKVEAPAYRMKYLRRAFDRDPDLRTTFRRRAIAKMYAYASLSMLGEADKQTTAFVRRYSLEAIRHWPLEWRAYLSLFTSVLGEDFRNRSLRFWRKIKYRPAKDPQRGSSFEDLD